MEISDLSLLLGVVVTIIALFVPIGVHLWKENRNKMELRNRIIEDLEIIRKKIQSDIEQHHFSSSICSTVYPIDNFINLKQKLSLKLKANQYIEILETYKKIQSLKNPLDIDIDITYFFEQNTNRYNEVVKKITETTEIL